MINKRDLEKSKRTSRNRVRKYLTTYYYIKSIKVILQGLFYWHDYIIKELSTNTGTQAKLVLYNFYIEGNYIVDAIIRLILRLCLSMV